MPAKYVEKMPLVPICKVAELMGGIPLVLHRTSEDTDHLLAFYVGQYCKENLLEEYITIHTRVRKGVVIHAIFLQKGKRLLAIVVDELQIRATENPHIV